MPYSQAALKTEITTDPNAYGYAQYIATGNYLAIKGIINQVRAAITVKRADIAPSEVLEVIDVRDLAYPGTGVIAAANQPLSNSYLESLTQLPSLRLMNDDGSDTRILSNLKKLIGDTQGSQTRLLAAANRQGSRSEQLFGTGFTTSEQNIADALAS